MVTKRGADAIRVLKPAIIKMEQKNSANTVADNEALEPIPNGSGNELSFCPKLISLPQP